jgi:hypothetical protein
MSSTIRFVNWSAKSVIPSLNGGDLSELDVSSASFNYYPYSNQAQRDASQPPSERFWGNSNSLTIRPVDGGDTQIYNDLSEPDGTAPNNELILWIFPDYVVFSQFENQLGDPIKPS